MKRLKCSHCGVTLEPGLERCPQCLRKRTGEVVEEGKPGPDVVRWIFLAGAWTLCVPVAWAYFAASPWLEAQHLELSATLFLATVVLLPPRFAFARLMRRARRRDALGVLGMVWGFAALLAGAVTLATRLTPNTPAAVLVGLITFLAPLLAVPPLLQANRDGTSRRRALRTGLLRFVGMSAALITLFGLRLLMLPRPIPRPPVVVVENPRSGLNPRDLEHAPVERAWRVDPTGLKQLHLSCAAPPFERALRKLKAELINALSELDQTPEAAPVVTLWVPASLDSAPARTAVARESDLLNDMFKKSKRVTPRGEPVQVVIAFGALPP